MAGLNENDVLESTLNIVYKLVDEKKVVLNKIQELKDFANTVEMIPNPSERKIEISDEEVFRLAMIGADIEADRLIRRANEINQRIGSFINITGN